LYERLRKREAEDIFTFYAPDGEFIPNPSPELLRELIFEKGQEYYAGGWGGGALQVIRYRVDVRTEHLSDQPSLEFFFVEPHGFFFRHYPPEGRELVPYDGSGCERLVEHYYGGDPMRVPIACFVPREAAWEIVQDFCRSRQPSSVVSWVLFGSLDFERFLDQ
jgi:hypothetical protein